VFASDLNSHCTERNGDDDDFLGLFDESQRLDYIALEVTMIDELDRIWKESVMT
jgi:hypothetical protein